MGTDKAFVDVDGRPMVVRVAEALRAGGCDPVRCQGGDVAGLAALGLDVVVETGGPGAIGPVRAIAAALAGLDSAEPAVIAACDLPGLTGPVVAELLAAGRANAAVAVAVSDGRRHLLAAWPPGVAPVVSALLAGGVESFHELIDRIEGVEVRVAREAVHNVNRPSDLSTGGSQASSPRGWRADDR